MRNRRAGTRGVALIMTVMVLFLVSALALALALTSSLETTIASNHRGSVEALFAADAALERALVDLAHAPDWDAVLQGQLRSTFADGPAGGRRIRPDGVPIDLTRLTNQANCNRVTACGDTELNAVTADRPWGANNPRWQLYAYGPLADLSPGAAVSSLFYLAVWVADDPSETDGDPARDGAGSDSPGESGGVRPGRGVLLVRAAAYGPRGARRTLDVTVARPAAAAPGEPPASQEATGLRVLAWRLASWPKP